MKTVIAILLLLVVPGVAMARQYYSADGHVIHSRLAPVLLHRALPPFKGQHVYENPRR